jgi:hypothetical protein
MARSGGDACGAGRLFTRPRTRALMRALLCAPVIALALGYASAAASSNQIVQTPQPLESSCPKGAGKPPVRGSHCVPVPVSMIQDETSSATGCGQSVFMQVPLIKGIVEYGALWTNINPGATPWLFTASGGRNGSGSGPYSEEYYSTKQVESPGGTIYKVPHGYGAWFVAAGGGPAPCDFRASSAVAWGWTARYAVTGAVTIAGSSGAAPHIRMQASCPSGGTTMTDAGGNYEFLLDRGACTIAPVLKRGFVSTPRQRSLNVTHNYSHVDFRVPCDAVPPAAGAARDVGSVSSAGAEPTGCKLIVKISWPNMKAARMPGLSFHPAASTSVDGGALFALRGAGSGSGVVSCATGCTELTVTVKAPVKPGSAQLAPVTDATLTAQVTPLASPPQNQGFLCTTGAAQVCGLKLSGLTAPDGVLQLVYWAPGVFKPRFPSFTVVADERCSQQLCSAMHRHGTDRKTLKLVPNVLADRAFTLTDGEKLVMGLWADATGTDEVVNAIGSYLSPSPGDTVYSLAQHVLDASEGDPMFGWAAAAVQVAYSAYTAAQQVEQSLIADFMGRFKLPEVGLGSTDANWCFNCHLSPLVQGAFLDKFANWIPGFADGTLYKFAKAIHKYPIASLDRHTIKAHLTITDLSFCSEASASHTPNNGNPQQFTNGESFYGCGPGYFSDAAVPPECGTGVFLDHPAWPGIQEYIGVDFVGTLDSKQLIHDAFVVPYNPFEWMYALQCGAL